LQILICDDAQLGKKQQTLKKKKKKKKNDVYFPFFF